jgi:uncharacterized membrane protein
MFSSLEEERPNVIQAIAHLYRGEMNRLTIYRQRLDITSNWCITMVSAFLVFYLSTSAPVHLALFPLLPVFAFSIQESRRYRYYRLVQHRIECLEKGFFVGDILRSSIVPAEQLWVWRERLNQSLFFPTHNISFFNAWRIRFFRNYIWMVYILFLAWICKMTHMTSVVVADTSLTPDYDSQWIFYVYLSMALVFVSFHILFMCHESRHTMDIDI